MSAALTQTTANDGPDGLTAAGLVVAIRWVFPLPVASPLWLDQTSVVVGRDADCDVTLDGGRVSRKHARFSRSGPLWLVSDLESKNGLYVNGQRAKSAALGPGDVVRIGDHVGVCVAAPLGTDLSFADLGAGVFGGAEHRAVKERLQAVAKSSLPIVIEGATGTGKERFAAALHEWSGRGGRLSAVNCAVYSKAVAAAELFGYRKGAFTGAEQASPGHIRAAEGGTLLLDELIELPLDVQAMLLRVIENREVLALGESRPTPIDVRFAAATQLPLARAVEAGRFRADLRARLEGAVVTLPALSDCREIAPELFVALLERHSGFKPELSAVVAERLCMHTWPLNIRELEMLTLRLASSGYRGEPLPVSALGELTVPAAAPEVSDEGRDSIAVPGRRAADAFYDESEMRALLAALAACGGNVSKAAQSLGLSRPKAYRMLGAATRAGLIS